MAWPAPRPGLGATIGRPGQNNTNENRTKEKGKKKEKEQEDAEKEKNKNDTILIYCYHGNSSQSAANFFSHHGFKNVFSMDEGYEGWLKEN